MWKLPQDIGKLHLCSGFTLLQNFVVFKEGNIDWLWVEDIGI
jgi:hypothetical protein